MSTRYDPELDDVLQDQELLRLGELLSSAVRPEPPLDDAFKSGLRRQLMHQAWEMGEGRPSLWKRAFAPPGMAWIGATAGLLLIASVVVFMATQPTSPIPPGSRCPSSMKARTAATHSSGLRLLQLPWGARASWCTVNGGRHEPIAPAWRTAQHVNAAIDD